MLSVKVLNRVSRISTICQIKQFSVAAQKDHYDVIIAGGGLVGVSLAVSLGNFTKFCFVYILVSFFSLYSEE